MDAADLQGRLAGAGRRVAPDHVVPVRAGEGVLGQDVPVSPVVEPASSVLLVVGREQYSPPTTFGGVTCAATHDCVAIAVVDSRDSPTAIGLSPSPDTTGLVLVGEFELESEGLLSLRDVYGREYDAIGVDPGMAHVTVWANRADRPDRLEVQVTAGP